MTSRSTIGLGGGCHWCTEAVIAALRGTEAVEQGFIAAAPPDDGFCEAVRVTFDERVLPLASLIEVHLRTHASQSDHSMRGRYRSAVYAVDDAMAERCRDALHALGPRFDAPLVTRVLRLAAFRLNDERYLRYREKRPDAPFCRTHIDPKLDLLERQYAPLLSRDG